jgi:hypothetical protein
LGGRLSELLHSLGEPLRIVVALKLPSGLHEALGLREAVV